MYRSLPFIGLFFLLFACSQLSKDLSFDKDWKFLKSDKVDGSKVIMDDSNWRTLSLPHDWSIEKLSVQDSNHIGPFIRGKIDSTETGSTLGGTGWYRKHFLTESGMKGKIVEVVFDGVMKRSDVWINGHHLGFHPNGYTPFRYNITPFLSPEGKDNILAVKTYNPGQNSRWYSGSGIYRPVRLAIFGKIYVPEWKTQVITTVDSCGLAIINFSFPVRNTYNSSKKIQAIIKIKDDKGNVVCSRQINRKISSQNEVEVKMSLPLEEAHLWSIVHPYLYKIGVSIFYNDKEIDFKENSFGIRTLSFSADKGFLLNGESLLLKGACVHHDNGLLGAAAYADAEIRKVKLLKKAGFNAIRTSHNPVSSSFLDACDSIGMLVIEEAFDCWEHPKRKEDYHLFFKEYSQKDLSSMILRDRNHPSIIMWSIGNEIFERADSTGLNITRELVSVVKELDKTRPVTEAICDFWDQKDKTWDDTVPAFELLDVCGYNYEWNNYVSDHKKFSKRIIVGTESFPREMFESWEEVKKNPFVIGDFVWTGMDYIGETGIGNAVYDSSKNKFASSFRSWPWYLSGCGELDICGYRKAQSYYRKVVWGQSNIEMVVHEPFPKGEEEHISKWGWPHEYSHWNWHGYEGTPLKVRVFASCDSVQLLLNNKEIATKPVDDKLMACFSVNYSQGELVAKGISNGNVVNIKKLITSGPPVKIKLITDGDTLSTDPNDLSFIRIEVVDAKGELVSDASFDCSISVTGAGELLSCGNAAPDDMNSFRQPSHISFYHGYCMAILRSNGTSGKIKLVVKTENLPLAECELFSIE